MRSTPLPVVRPSLSPVPAPSCFVPLLPLCLRPVCPRASIDHFCAAVCASFSEFPSSARASHSYASCPLVFDRSSSPAGLSFCSPPFALSRSCALLCLRTNEHEYHHAIVYLDSHEFDLCRRRLSFEFHPRAPLACIWSRSRRAQLSIDRDISREEFETCMIDIE